MRPVPRIQLTCVTCGAAFEKMQCEIKHEGYGKYCSMACQFKGRLLGSNIPCEACGKIVYRKRTEIGKHTFCSRVCYNSKRPVSPDGYKKIGSVHEHRIVAEQKLGRPLRKGEVVHHVDVCKSNNAPSNLDVLPGQSDHARLHFTGVKQDPEMVRRRMETKRLTLARKKAEAVAISSP